MYVNDRLHMYVCKRVMVNQCPWNKTERDISVLEEAVPHRLLRPDPEIVMTTTEGNIRTPKRLLFLRPGPSSLDAEGAECEFVVSKHMEQHSEHIR